MMIGNLPSAAGASHIESTNRFCASLHIAVRAARSENVLSGVVPSRARLESMNWSADWYWFWKAALLLCAKSSMVALRVEPFESAGYHMYPWTIWFSPTSLMAASVSL